MKPELQDGDVILVHANSFSTWYRWLFSHLIRLFDGCYYNHAQIYFDGKVYEADLKVREIDFEHNTGDNVMVLRPNKELSAEEKKNIIAFLQKEMGKPYFVYYGKAWFETFATPKDAFVAHGKLFFNKWGNGPNVSQSAKTIWLNCKIWYYDSNGNSINDPDPDFPTGWERAIVASNSRYVNIATQGSVVYKLIATQDPIALTYTYAVPILSNNVLNPKISQGQIITVTNPDGRDLYITPSGSIIEASSVMGQYDYFDLIAQNQQIVLYPFISQVITSEANNYNTFITRS